MLNSLFGSSELYLLLLSVARLYHRGTRMKADPESLTMLQAIHRWTVAERVGEGQIAL